MEDLFLDSLNQQVWMRVLSSVKCLVFSCVSLPWAHHGLTLGSVQNHKPEGHSCLLEEVIFFDDSLVSVIHCVNLQLHCQR